MKTFITVLLFVFFPLASFAQNERFEVPDIIHGMKGDTIRVPYTVFSTKDGDRINDFTARMEFLPWDMMFVGVTNHSVNIFKSDIEYYSTIAEVRLRWYGLHVLPAPNVRDTLFTIDLLVADQPFNGNVLPYIPYMNIDERSESTPGLKYLYMEDDSEPVSVEENVPSAEKTISIYPNPVVDVAKVEGDGTGEVYDVMGRLLFRFELPGDLDMNEYPAGMYFLRTETKTLIFTKF